MNSLINVIKKHISKDRLTTAVDLLLDYYKKEMPHDADQVRALSRELYSIENALLNGLIKWEEANQIKNRLTLNMLRLTNNRIGLNVEMEEAMS